jgi:hypothetical protein
MEETPNGPRSLEHHSETVQGELWHERSSHGDPAAASDDSLADGKYAYRQDRRSLGHGKQNAARQDRDPADCFGDAQCSHSLAPSQEPLG